MRLGTETGSVLNHLMSGGGQPAPAVGMAATVLYWSDRHAATVIKVTAKTVTVQEDKAVRTDQNGMSEVQQYDYSPDPEGRVLTFRLNKKGAYVNRKSGRGLLLGVRRHYHDYSF
jgi:hypothetical protein